MLCRLLSLQLANHHHQGQHSSFDKNNHFMMLHEDNNSTFGVEKGLDGDSWKWRMKLIFLVGEAGDAVTKSLIC